jgi:hypothetical protein
MKCHDFNFRLHARAEITENQIFMYALNLIDDRCGVVPFMEHARRSTRLSTRGTSVKYTCEDGYWLTPRTNVSYVTIYCNGSAWSEPAAHCTGEETNDSFGFIRIRYQ